MKRISCLCITLLFIVLISCDNSNETIEPAETSVEKVENISTVEMVITPVTPLPFMTNYDLNIMSSYNTKIGDKPNSRTTDWQEFGPFTVNSTLTRIRENTRLFLSNIPGLASGIYICDVYQCTAEVTLPNGAVMLYESSSKVGFVSSSTQEIGVSVSQVGNRYNFYTYSIVPKFTVLGQSLPFSVHPTDLQGTTFTYSYLQFI